MAATIQVISGHGVAFTTTETQIDGAAIKYKWADNDTNDTINPIVIPAAGTNYSWRKSMKGKVTVTPAGSVSNFRWYSDGGAWGTGVVLNGHSVPTANYTQPSAADQAALIAVNGGSAITDVATFTAGAPLTMNGGAVVLSNPSTGYGTQDIFETQLAVGTTAVRGPTNSRTFTLKWDES